jgi:hypothetical protein
MALYVIWHIYYIGGLKCGLPIVSNDPGEGGKGSCQRLVMEGGIFWIGMIVSYFIPYTYYIMGL